MHLIIELCKLWSNIIPFDSHATYKRDPTITRYQSVTEVSHTDFK